MPTPAPTPYAYPYAYIYPYVYPYPYSYAYAYTLTPTPTPRPCGTLSLLSRAHTRPGCCLYTGCSRCPGSSGRPSPNLTLP